jgi:hypothetical protein
MSKQKSFKSLNRFLLNSLYYKKLSLIVILFSFALSGCASIIGSTSQQISVQAFEHTENTTRELYEVNCELYNDKGKWFVITPGSVLINRSNDPLLGICRKARYSIARISTPSDIKISMFGNIIFGGIIGGIVDHKTGAGYEYPSSIQVNMVAIEPEKKSRSKKY